MRSRHVDALIRSSASKLSPRPSHRCCNDNTRHLISGAPFSVSYSSRESNLARQRHCLYDGPCRPSQRRYFSLTRPKDLAPGKALTEQNSLFNGAPGPESTVPKPHLGAVEDARSSRANGSAAITQWRHIAPAEAIESGLDKPSHDEVSWQQPTQPPAIKHDDLSSQRKKTKSTIRREESTQEQLETELQFVAHSRPRVLEVQSILRILYEQFAIKATAVHYEAMILANCDPEHGSLVEVKALLAEMEKEGVAIGTSIHYAVLKVLAIHPDHLLRTTILSQMQAQWTSPNAAARHHVIAGLIHDGQLELALAQITPHHNQNQNQNQHQSTNLEPWLYITLLHALCAAADFPAVQQLIYLLEDHRVEISSPLTWLLLLEAASSAHDLDLVRYIWVRQVELLCLKPPDSVCRDALLAASRAGDVGLAEKVVQVMARRESGGEAGLDEDVWEVLGDAYESAGDREGRERVRLRRETALQTSESRSQDVGPGTESCKTEDDSQSRL